MRICVIDDLVSVNLVESMLNCNLANSIYIINEGQYKEKNFSISHGTLCTALLVETLKKYNCENLVEIIFYSIVDEKGNKSYANLLKALQYCVSQDFELVSLSMGVLGKEASIKIVGTYVTKKENDVPDMLVPVNWLREEAVRAGLKYFVYTSCNAIVDNPLKLHEFKTHMIEIGFVPIDPVIDDYATGKGLIIDDELFVKAARELRQNINLLSNMYIPFCTLIIGITSLTMFLIIYNTRHDIALANSLGVSKWYIIVGISIGLISLNTLGCTTTLLILWTTLHVSTFSVFVVFKMFMFCVVISVVIVLLILRRMRLYDLINMY